MARTGFRLFQFTAHNGLTHPAIPLGMGSGAADLAQYLAVLMEPRLGELVEQVEGKTRSGLKLTAIQTLGACAVFGRVRAGIYDQFDAALPGSPDEADRSLRGLAPANTFRFLFLQSLPGSPYGLLMVEVRGRRCPYGPLYKAIRKWSRDVPGPLGSDLRIVPESAVDPDQFREWLEQGRAKSIELVGTERVRNNEAKPRKYHLSVSLVDDDGPIAIEILRQALSAGGKRQHKNLPTLVRPAKSLFPGGTDLSQFSTGSVTLEMAAGGSKTFEFGDDDEYFTYVVDPSGEEVADAEFFAAVVTSVRSVTLQSEDLHPSLSDVVDAVLEAVRNGETQQV